MDADKYESAYNTEDRHLDNFKVKRIESESKQESLVIIADLKSISVLSIAFTSPKMWLHLLQS
jgi:hypothetical protein